jgi:hypothetical protein
MEESTQYRHFAEECLRLMKQAKSEHERTVLQQMADAWQKLADEPVSRKAKSSS